MTPAKAKVVFATHMQAARSRKLNQYELNQLSTARQVLRRQRKPAMNARKFSTTNYIVYGVFDSHDKARSTHKKVRGSFIMFDNGKWYVLKQKSGQPIVNAKFKQNPSNVLIYGEVDTIYAKKSQNHKCDADCKSHGHRYFHKFSSKPKMYGLPDGTLLIKP